MNSVVIRDAARADYEAICALNLEVVQETSAMDVDRLATLANLACHFKVACAGGAVVAFVLAIGDGAPYRNDNYAWFAQRYPRFTALMSFLCQRHLVWTSS
jgi:predicted GNAT superfamily acetyltransferase